MVEVRMTYDGDLHCTATHGPSRATLSTDAPADNMGKGESFSPTDLVGTALGTCMMTIMGIAAQKMNVDMRGTTAVVTKEMTSAPPRRIARLEVNIHVPTDLNDEQRQKLQNAAMTCPVHRSLHPDVQSPVTFRWGK
jgi:putative redox protein